MAWLCLAGKNICVNVSELKHTCQTGITHAMQTNYMANSANIVLREFIFIYIEYMYTNMTEDV